MNREYECARIRYSDTEWDEDCDCESGYTIISSDTVSFAETRDQPERQQEQRMPRL